MIEVYVKLVTEGMRSIESIPQKYKDDVERIISERKEVEQNA